MAYETETDHETHYCFPAINTSCIKGKRSRHEYNIMYVFFSLLSAWTVFLNLLVIISISHFKKLHTPTNLIILSLAVADMLIGLVMPIDATRLIETCWYFGDTFCGLFSAMSGLLVSASLYSLILIAVDRYVAVCYPLLYQQKITTTKTVCVTCISWLWSSAYNISFVLDNKYFDPSIRTYGCYGQCSFMINFAWSMTDLFLCFLFPCSVIIILYLKIFYVVHRQVKVINSLMKSSKCVTESSVRRKSESKAALTLGIIVTVYLFCYIPYYITSLTANKVIYFKVVRFLLWILYINSGLNPLIYALFYCWFKVSVKHIITFKIFQTASSLIDIFTDHNQS